MQYMVVESASREKALAISSSLEGTGERALRCETDTEESLARALPCVEPHTPTQTHTQRQQCNGVRDEGKGGSVCGGDKAGHMPSGNYR